MIRNYFLIAIRSLWRNKMVTLINLVGMAIGFGIFLTLWTWVQNDLNYDRFHKDIDQIYTLKVRFRMNDAEYTSDRSSGIYTSLLPENFSQITSSCRVSQPLDFELAVRGDTTADSPDMKYFSEDEVLAVDSSFLRFFTFKLLKGDISLIFTERNHIVITESLAVKLFGDADCLDQTVRIGEGGYYNVVGVVEDVPSQSSLKFQALLGFHIMEELGYPVDGYSGTMYLNFFKLNEESDLKAVNTAINELVGENYESDMNEYFFLDEFSRMYLYGERRSIIGLYLNLIMSMVILTIACINFINLSTASSLTRVKEIIIRKSVGARKRQLIIQFMTETYLLLALALYLGLFIAEHLVPAIGRGFGVPLNIDFSTFSDWLKILSIFLITGLIAGLYPAYKIAGFKPLAFMSGKSISKYKAGSKSRKVLIVVQFTFSIIIIIVSVFVIRQYAYLKEADLGFNRNDVIYIQTNGKAWEQYDLIKKDLSELHFVEGISTGSAIPTMIDHGDIDWGEREGDHNKIARMMWTDEDFLKTFDIELLEGDFFDADRDTLNYDYVVVNQSLIDLMGWEDPIGRTFYLWGEDRQILGVTDNINFFPFNLKVFGNEALIYLYDDVREYIFARVRPGTSAVEISKMKEIFHKHNPGYEFIYDFVSDYEYETLKSSDGLKFVFKLFSGLAIFIAVIGLIGLSVFNNTRRTKEVGIRKVLGANPGIIMKLLLSEFIKLVLLANVIAIPISYFLLNKGLSFFSYSVDLKASVFIAVFLFTLFLSLVIVTYHAFRIASSNPSDSLRYE